MAPVIPLVAAVAGLGVATELGIAGTVGLGLLNAGIGLSVGTAAFLGTAAAGLAGFVVSTAINAVGGRVFSPKSNNLSGVNNFLASSQSRAVMIRSSVETHKIIYGQAKVSGPIVYITTTNSGPDKSGATVTGTNLFLHMVIALAGHEVDSIGDIYFNDQPVSLDTNGWVTSSPYVASNSTSSTTKHNVVTAVRTDGVVTVTTDVAHGIVAGDRVSVTGNNAVAGNASFLVTAVPTTKTVTLSYSGGPNASSAGGTITNYSSSTSTTSFARVKKFTGSSSQAVSADLLAEVPGWDATHRLQGIAYVYVRLQFDQNIFAQGIPNIGAVVKGKKVYDPRGATTAWSDNAALCIRDYLTSDYGFACQSGEVNDTYFSAAANHCDEDVTLTTGGTQHRYTCNGVLDTATAPVDNLNALVATTAGAVTYVQGLFRCYAGVYDSPAGDLAPTMLAGSVKIHTRTTRQQLFNAVRGTYVDPSLNWQPTDFPPVTNATYQANDNGQQIFKDIQLPFTNHPEAAQRIAKVILEQGRQAITIELTLNHKAIPYAVWDTVTYTDATLGWDHKVFRIKKLTTQGIGPIVLSLQEEASGSYDWNSGMATTLDLAPDTNLPDPFTVSPAKALSVTESLYVTRDGAGVKAKATLTWLASQDVFLYQYEPQYQLMGASVWTILPRTQDTTADALDITPGIYNFRVKAINTLGVSSTFSTASLHVSGLSAPPTEPQNLTISCIGGLAVLRWDGSPDLDVRIGGSYVFRHSPSTTDGWPNSTTIGDAVPGSSNSVILPLKPGIYLAKAVDSSGIESTTAAGVITTQDSTLPYTNLTSLTENATFGGSKTNCQVTSSRLTMTSTASDGTYLWHANIDLGSVKSVRLTSHMQAFVVNVTDLIDSRTGNIDDWASIDGSISADADARTYFRSTQTDPAGSPVWSAWNRLDSSEVSARGFQLKTILSSIDPAYNIQISELNVQVDQAT